MAPGVCDGRSHCEGGGKDIIEDMLAETNWRMWPLRLLADREMLSKEQQSAARRHGRTRHRKGLSRREISRDRDIYQDI